MRLFISPRGTRHKSDRLRRAKIAESSRILDRIEPLRGFAHQSKRAVAALRTFFEFTHRCSKKVWAYGASPNGSVLLQRCRVGKSQLEAIAERDPNKFNLVSPGGGIPIRSQHEMRAAQPDYLLVMDWANIDKILERERQYLENGGKIIAPLPELRTFSRSDL